MKKYIFASSGVLAGLAVCLVAPAGWQLIGVFCAGGGCYALIEALKMERIAREIERYEQPPVKIVAEAKWQWLALPPLRTPQHIGTLARRPHRPLSPSLKRLSGRAASIARAFILTHS